MKISVITNMVNCPIKRKIILCLYFKTLVFITFYSNKQGYICIHKANLKQNNKHFSLKMDKYLLKQSKKSKSNLKILILREHSKYLLGHTHKKTINPPKQKLYVYFLIQL